MAEAGKILQSYTHIEIDESGKIWCIHNHFESDSVIMEMESTARGEVIYDNGFALFGDYDDDLMFGEDYL
jgi:hypothetical protein